MNSSELRNKIIKHVEYFEDDQLEAFYAILVDFINSQKEEAHSSQLIQQETDGNSVSNTNDEIKDKTQHEQAIHELRAKYRKY